MPDIPETSPDASITVTPADAVMMARNIARKWRVAVFPCLPDKRPACPHGFKDASADPDVVQALWERWPGPLIGIATGAVSGVWVLDIDSARHNEAVDWWQAHNHLLLPTRAYRTRSGGLHLYFRDGEGIGNTAGRLCTGVDTRGDGGYVVFWFAAGCEALDTSRAAPWPAWLRRRLAPPKVEPGPYRRAASDGGAVSGILDALERAQPGERNALLFWSACRLVERGMQAREVERLLLPTASSLGLDDLEARRTIASAHAKGATRGTS